MAMDLSPTAQHYVDIVRKLTPELETLADQWGGVYDVTAQADPVSTRIYELFIENDLLRLTLPTEWGGKGISVTDYFAVLQEVAKIHGTLRMIVHGANGMWRLVHQYGTEEQKQYWLTRFAEGAIFTFGLTEPGNGTGRDLSTTAVLDGDEWVINGTKWLISFAETADLIHLVAATGRDEHGKTLTCFLLPKGTPGVTVEPLAKTMGCEATTHDRMVFKNARLPKDAVLGEVGDGLNLGLRGFLDISRLGIAGSALGLARKALELATEFSHQRVTFGKPIASRQAIKLSLAEMASDIYATQSAVLATCAKYDRGESVRDEAAMCKLLAIEMVGRVTDKALRMHGGIGYTKEYKIERHYRDARALWFEEGTAEVQKLVIGNAVVAGDLVL